MRMSTWMGGVFCALAISLTTSLWGAAAVAPSAAPSKSAKPAAAKPAPAASALGLKTLLSRMELKEGDTVVFLGDSITHQCLYTQYVEDFYYTRFPKLRVHFHNAGIGGDRAADALARFDDDVAAYKPRYVTILLGMNDGGYRGYDQAIFDTYQKDMTELLDRLAEIKAIAIPMTPTMYDSRANRLRNKKPEARDLYYNGVLALFGAWLGEMAQERGLGFVDMYSPLNDLSFAERKRDAAFTLIKDAVHPDAPGQVIMATAIIEGICPRGAVSSISIQERAGKLVGAAAGGKLTDFQVEGDMIRFTFTAAALPWVLPEEALPGYQLTHAGHRYSNEAFSARNLKPGRYELKIDGQSAGTWADTQLAFRVELETNAKTPQYQQALNVAMLNKERNEKFVRPLRNLWLQRKIQLAKSSRPEGQKEVFEKWLAEEFRPNLAKLNALGKDYEEQIYRANQPVPRRYELVRVK